MRARPSTSNDEQVRGLIARAAEIANARGEPAASQRLMELGDRLQHRDFNLAVLGEFKRGKSTLVNALLGAPVLPTGVLPLTSVVTRVSWGGEPKALIRFEDGTSRPIPLAQLEEFVTESANPRNRLRVAAAEVEVPADLLRGGVIIMDTPGVGSTLVHNTDTTLRLLRDVDGAIFVTAADPPISMDERSFLAAVKEHAHKTFFVLNKIDALESADQDEVCSFTRSVIRDEMGHDVEMFPVSARRAMHEGDAGLDVFRHALDAFLEHGLSGAGIASIARKTCEVIAWLRTSIVVELEALHLSVAEITLRKDDLSTVRRAAQRVAVELDTLVKAEVVSLVTTLDQVLRTWRTAETARLIEEARRGIEGGRVRPADLDQHIKDLLRSHVEAWRPQLEAGVRSGFSAASARFVQQADEAAAGATRASSEVLDLELPPTPSIDGLSEHSRFTYSFFEVPTLMESLLPDPVAALPTGWAGRIVLRRARQKIPGLVDKHSGRLRYDLVTRLQSSARELTRELDRHLAGTTQGLETALGRALGRIGELERSEEGTSGGLIAVDEELFTLSDRLWDSVRDAQEGPPWIGP